MKKVSSFRERFCELCKERRISQLALAKQLHVASQTISSWQNGIRTPKDPTIMTIAGYFNVDPNWLMGYDSEKGTTIPNKISSFQERFRELLQIYNTKASTVARELGISKQTISMWLKGTRSPKKATMIAMAQHFHVSTDWLMGLDSSTTSKTEIVNDATIKIKRREEDGYKQITVRINEDIMEALDKLVLETNYSRNELINLLLRHGVDHVEIE